MAVVCMSALGVTGQFGRLPGGEVSEIFSHLALFF